MIWAAQTLPSPELIGEAIRQGAGFAFGVVVLVLWHRSHRSDIAAAARREDRLVIVVEAGAASDARHATACEQVAREVADVARAVELWDRERLKEFGTLLQAIRESAPIYKPREPRS